MRARLLAALGALFAVIVLACAVGGQGGPVDDKFVRDCTAKGWVVHTHKQGSSRSRTCDPPPQPQPLGWQ